MAEPLTVTGQAEVANGLDAVAAAAANMTEPHKQVVTKLIPDVRSRTPRRTGALALSWQPAATATGGSVTSGLRQSVYIEFGTRRGIAAYAPVRETIDANEAAIGKQYEDAIAAAAKRAGFRVDQ